MRIVLPAGQREEIDQGPFHIRRVRPGRPLEVPGGDGFGPLGAFDHAYLEPGTVIGMHEHRNDEIISYMRRGTMLHEDTSGARLPLTPVHFSVMNTGRGFSHSERVAEDGEPVDMLQIFVRPRAEGLEPRIQHHALDAAESVNAWRLVAGPEDSGAPLTVRNAVWIHDAHLEGGLLAVPERDGLQGLLYVFSGEVAAGADRLRAGDSLLLLDEPGGEVRSDSPADLVLFHIDPSAPASRAGTLSA